MSVALLIVVESKGSDGEACASQSLAGTCGAETCHRRDPRDVREYNISKSI
jgi:hypothetical protein